MADDETMRALEHEMGVLVRRIRRLIAERARLVHPELSPVGYSIMVALLDDGRVGPATSSTSSPSTRVRSAGRCRPCVELGLVERTPDPEDRRAATLAITDEGARRLETVAEKRREEVKGRLKSGSPTS